MLKQRIFTALMLIICLLWALFFAHPLAKKIIIAILILAGAWEWSALMQLSTPLKRITYLLLLTSSFVFIQLTRPFIIIYLAVIFWLLASFLLLRFSRGQRWIFVNKYAKAGLGLLILLPLWVSLVHLLNVERHSFLVLLLLGTVIAADTGAYFSGRFLGKHTLASAISPNKTIEGVIGGLVTAAITAYTICLLFSCHPKEIILYVLISIFTALFSVLGDLLESAMKRQAKVKNSGNLLPGHGGVLDRIDGYTAAAPFFTLMVSCLGG